jgi:hypothetical protein
VVRPPEAGPQQEEQLLLGGLRGGAPHRPRRLGPTGGGARAQQVAQRGQSMCQAHIVTALLGHAHRRI